MNYVGSLSASIFMSVIYHYVLVFIDHLIKMRYLVLTAIMKVKEVTQAFYVYVWKLHGLPESFISDYGTQFTSEVWSHLCQMLRINAKYFTAYHPETDEQMKHFNAIMKHYLQAFINYMQDDWAKWISDAEFAANCDSPGEDSSCEWLSRLTWALALVNTGGYLVLLALALFFLL